MSRYQRLPDGRFVAPSGQVARPAEPYATGVAPGPGPIQASLTPPTMYQWATSGIPSVRRPAYYSTVAIPQDERIGLFPRKRPIEAVVDQAVNTPITRPIRVGMPFTIYAMVGWATPSNGTALPDNLHPLATFLIDIRNDKGDLYTNGATLARDVLGTAERPAQVGANGFVFDRGATLIVTITPLVASLRISTTFYGVEFQGPSNIAG